MGDKPLAQTLSKIAQPRQDPAAMNIKVPIERLQARYYGFESVESYLTQLMTPRLYRQVLKFWASRRPPPVVLTKNANAAGGAKL